MKSSNEDSVIFEYTPVDYEALKRQWKEEEKQRKGVDIWVVRTAEELLTDLSLTERAERIGMDLKKYRKIKEKLCQK